MKATIKTIMLTVAALAAFSQAMLAINLPAPMPEFMDQQQLQEWREEWQEKTINSQQSTLNHFYTGKPYLESTGQYAFLFRSYDPKLSRWTLADPSGFPDGANNWQYVINNPLIGFDIQGLKTGLITGLDITLRVYRSGNWVDLTDGGDIYKSKDTRFELLIYSDPNDPEFMLDADRKPLGGYAVDKDPSGQIYPELANQSIGGFDGLPIVSGAQYWQPRYWPTGHTYPLVKLDGSISSMLVDGVWNALVLYNPNSDPTPFSWTVGGSIKE